MQSDSYVVHLVGCDDPDPFKYFGTRVEAVAYGQNRVQSGAATLANIYVFADATDAIEAVATCKMEKGKYVQSCSRHASDAEIESANKRAWEAALKEGPGAALKLIGLGSDTSPEPNKIPRRRI